jgi:phospholipid/cholesterol/gamma-HCH transport system substrate-binding protein
MERNANYTLVGFASLILMIAVVAFVIWLGRVQFARDYDLYDIVFIGPVRGLTQGGEVHFNGIKVGEVTEVALDAKDPTRVIARSRINSKVPIRTDSYATLEPQGITGVNYIQITAGTSRMPLLKDATPKDQVPVLRSQSSALSDLLEGGGTVLARTVEALDRVNRILSDKNIATFSASLSDVNVVTAEMRDRKEVFADAQAALQSIDRAASDISKTAQSAQGLVDGDGKKALANINDAASELKGAATDARATIGALRGPTTDFATNGLPQLQQTITSLQGTAESLQRLIDEIEANPRQLVGKTPAREIEVEP